MKELNLQEIQQESLKILVEIDRLCTKYDLTYFLAYGTLLGAIRHKGFIPWDDDIDIWMPRKDYDQFSKICEEETKYKLCTRKNTKNYPFGIPRLSNMEYRYITTQKNMKNIDIGVFVDIYPLDNYCSSVSDAKKLQKNVLRLNQKYMIYVAGESCSENSSFKKILKKLLHIILNVYYGKDYHLKIDNEIMEVVNRHISEEDTKIGVPTWDDKYIEFEKSYFSEKQLINFENYQFWIPSGYDKILKVLYNDYMKLPDEDKRYPHHNYKIIKRF